MKRALAVACMVVASATASADEAGHARLVAEITAADAKLFGGLNDRDIGPMKEGFSRRLEFYHDRTGVTGYDDNIAIFERNFRQANRVTRQAMPETVQVYPAGPDHAMEIGKHRFCNQEPAAPAPVCSVYGFSMVWAREDGQWKLLRVLSYGH